MVVLLQIKKELEEQHKLEKEQLRIELEAKFSEEIEDILANHKEEMEKLKQMLKETIEAQEADR